MPVSRWRWWRRLVTITRPFFQSELRWTAAGMLGLLIGLLLSVAGLNIVNNFVYGHFMTAVAERQGDRYTKLALMWGCVFAASAVIAAFIRFTEERLRLKWREWLTAHLLDRYLSGHAYYRLHGRADVDNPDQRITEDVKSFTANALGFFLIAFNSTVALISFSSILWTITPWLFLAAVLYALGGTLMTILVGRKLMGFDSAQLKKEADLRYDLIQVREHAEPIALLRGERDENARLRGRLGRVVANMRKIITLNRNIAFFTESYNYMTQLLPLLIVAPLYMKGRLEFGEVTQGQAAFSFVIGAFSLIVKEFPRVAEFGAVIERLGGAWEVIEEETGAASQKTAIEIEEDGSRVAYQGLTLTTPRDSRLLIEDLSVEVPRGERLLIMGPDGSGRTSLLRATAGLWTKGGGRIVRPPLDDVLFLPEQPYLGPGTLRDQLKYAVRRDGLTDDDLLDALRQVKFERILERVGGLDVERDWSRTLSLSEQQILAFARLLLADPAFAFLDEAASALDTAKGRHLYEVLSRTGISYISVATDAGLMAYHDRLLELYAGGAWQFTPSRHAVSA